MSCRPLPAPRFCFSSSPRRALYTLSLRRSCSPSSLSPRARISSKHASTHRMARFLALCPLGHHSVALRVRLMFRSNRLLRLLTILCRLEWAICRAPWGEATCQEGSPSARGQRTTKSREMKGVMTLLAMNHRRRTGGERRRVVYLLVLARLLLLAPRHRPIRRIWPILRNSNSNNHRARPPSKALHLLRSLLSLTLLVGMEEAPAHLLGTVHRPLVRVDRRVTKLCTVILR